MGIGASFSCWSMSTRMASSSILHAYTGMGPQANTPTGVEAEGRQIMLYRHDGRLYAIDNICSHAGGLLSRGPVADLTVTCPLHGSRFSLATGCVSRGPASQPQPVLPTRIRNGWIEVRGSQPAPRRPASGRTPS